MKKIIEYFKIHFLLTDSLIAFILFYLGRLLLNKIFHIGIEALLEKNSGLLYPIFFNSGITLLGFLLTGVSIIIVFLQSDKLSILSETSHPKMIMKIYFSAIRYCSIFTALSFIGMVSLVFPFFSHILLLFSLLSIIRLIRCVWIIESVAEILF